MIEILRHSEADDTASLVVDGVVLDTQRAAVRMTFGGHGYAQVRSHEAAHLIGSQLIKDIPKDLWRLIFYNLSGSEADDLQIRPQFLRNDEGLIEFSFIFAFRAPYWKRPWSMAETKSEILRLIGENPVFPEQSNRPRIASLPNFYVDLGRAGPAERIGELVNRWGTRMAAVWAQAESRLALQARSDSIVALFDFPPEVRAPCEQYLLYFVEFLKDLGVEAQADLTHDAGRVLFSITPASGKEALDRIREALEVYLGLPGARDFGDTESITRDPRIQQLIANIQHLKSQLYLATAALQFKDATIAQLSSTSGQPAQLPGEVLSASLQVIQSSAPESVDHEEMLDGLVELHKYKGRFYEVNLPEIYRRLRHLFLGATDTSDDAPE